MNNPDLNTSVKYWQGRLQAALLMAAKNVNDSSVYQMCKDDAREAERALAELEKQDIGGSPNPEFVLKNTCGVCASSSICTCGAGL
jgi:hypothetical protein